MQGRHLGGGSGGAPLPPLPPSSPQLLCASLGHSHLLPIEGGWGCTPQLLLLLLRMGYPLLPWSLCCPRGYCSCLGCHVLVGALIFIGAVGASLLLLSFLVPHPAVIVTVGAWWVDVAVVASLLVLVAVWSPQSSWSWCPPYSSSWPWVPPRSSSWLCGAPLVIIMAVPPRW